MKADAAPILAIFEKKLRLEVPLFQRQYVWTQEHQWEPLWEDISRKFVEVLGGRKDGPVHFLGAMVLDQKQTPTTHVERRQIIDGQQRLTTFQIFLATFRDFCVEQQHLDLADECDGYTFNKGMMADAHVDKFKVWPTQMDRSQFEDVLTSRSRAALELKHPLTRRKYARKYDPRPRMVDAYLFFYDQLLTFFVGTANDPPFAFTEPLTVRLEECFNVLRSALQVVVIDLEQTDDAQVIFETLNARGAPLSPADLLRNFIFLRAARQGEDQEKLYREFWDSFDDEFWRTEIRQGRLNRSRSDIFLQHFLASQQGLEIPINHLFVEYKFWINKKNPFPSVRDELATLSRQRTQFRRLLDPKIDDQLYQLASALVSFDTSTAYPLLLFLLDAKLSEPDLSNISRSLESYIVRRSVCNLTSKAYNRVFLAVMRQLREQGPTPLNFRSALASLTGESSIWPRDDVFREAWRSQRAYEAGQSAKIVYILRRLSATYQNGKVEDISILSPLSVEHIMPQNWAEHWPLDDGSLGVSEADLLDADVSDPRVDASIKRNQLLNTMGNLTIVSQPLNSALSNAAWNEKKPALLMASLLPVNQLLYNCDAWDETAIRKRADLLFQKALQVWPGA
jgi:hypothetical protein